MSTCVSRLDTHLMTRIAGVWHSNAVLELRWFSRLTLLEMVGCSSFPRQRQAGPLEETWLSRKTSRHQKVPSTEPDHGPESQTGDKTIVKTRILPTSRLHQNDSVFNKDLCTPFSSQRATDQWRLRDLESCSNCQRADSVSAKCVCFSATHLRIQQLSATFPQQPLPYDAQPPSPKSQDQRSPRVMMWSR